MTLHSSPWLRSPARRRLAGLALSGALAALSPAVLAQSDYPARPIDLIVSYGPGGGTDLVARMMAPFLQKYLGGDARIVVLNRPGAGGAIGFAEIARAKPDGYTIGFVNTPNLLTIPIERETTFTWKDFDLLGNVVDDPDSFAVHADEKIGTLKELADHARAHPGEVTVGTTGTGSDDHLAMLLYQKSSGTQLRHIPYKGAGEVRGALAGRQITVAATNVGEVLQYQQGGTPLKFLGQMAIQRSSMAPDVPTFKEQGYDMALASLRGMAAPRGLPPEVREKLVQAIARTVQDSEFRKKAAELYAPLRYLAPDAYAAELEQSEAGFRELWKEMPWVER